MPMGLFKTELDGDSFFGRLKCTFGDRRVIVDPEGQAVGMFKLNAYTTQQHLWDLVVQGRTLHFPLQYVSLTDYPVSLEITEDDQKVAVIHSGPSGSDDYSLEWDGQRYAWADVSRVRKVMELQRDGETLARAHSEGLMINHTFVDVKSELPLEIICLLFCMYGGIVRHRTA